MPDPQKLENRDIITAVRQQLEILQQIGLTHLPVGKEQFGEFWSQSESTLAPEPHDKMAYPKSTTVEQLDSGSVPPVRETATPYPPKPTSPSPPTIATLPNEKPARQCPTPIDPWGPSLPLNERIDALRILQSEVAACTKCQELSSGRNQTVFGVGNPAARLVFVGEGPGAEEDRQGEPFVGAAGQLLDKILAACQLDREDVFILNAVKCRPPRNRNPKQEELAECWGFAEQQLEILRPEFICCLGSVAAKTLLKTTQSLGRLRKQFHSYRGSQVLVTYHPAYLLRTPSAKRHVWDDMKMLMKEMGVDLSK